MSFTLTNPVVVGYATKKDHYDVAFANALHIFKLLKAGLPFHFGGSPDQGNVGTGYVSGATSAALVPWTGILYVPDCAIFDGQTMALEALLKAESAGATATLALFNLTDGTPDTALANSPITSTDTTGARVRTSSAITLPVSGAKAFGVKLHSGHASLQAWSWGIRFFPVD